MFEIADWTVDHSAIEVGKEFLNIGILFDIISLCNFCMNHFISATYIIYIIIFVVKMFNIFCEMKSYS